ncbi:MAG: universal stress protein [Bacteroidia bacterium]
MAIVIQNFMLVSSGKNTCQEAIDLSSKLALGTGAAVTAVHFGETKPDYHEAFPAANFKLSQYSEQANHKNISKIVLESPPDLLMISTKSDGNNGGIVSASDAIKIIDHFERMVLTVPCNGTKFDFSNIVVPIDTSFETRQKTPYALTMAKAFNSTLHVVGVSNDTGKDAEVAVKNYSRQVSNHIEEKGFRCKLDMRLGGNPTEQIIQYAKENNAGMIIIMTEQETGFVNLFKGKYSEQMIKNAPIPVLSIHPKDLVVSEARL